MARSPIHRRNHRVAPESLRQRGVALAVLVWFLAAMSLLVGAIAMQARVDIKLTQLHASRAKAEAAGDGAIQLALADMLLREREVNFDPSIPFAVEYRRGGLQIRVKLLPVTGLIDLNRATEDLLARLFASVEGVEEGRARELAFNVVQWRSAGGAIGEFDGENGTSPNQGGVELRNARLEAIEDLLLVPGVDRRVFDSVRDAVYVSQRGQSGVDWKSAPASVLRALGDLDEQQSRQLVEARDQEDSPEGIAPAEIDTSFQQSDRLSDYRVDAVVSSGADRFLRRRWVERGRSGRDGLPWSFFRSEPVRSLSRGPGGQGGRGCQCWILVSLGACSATTCAELSITCGPVGRNFFGVTVRRYSRP